jgi:hypothetical protein
MVIDGGDAERQYAARPMAGAFHQADTGAQCRDAGLVGWWKAHVPILFSYSGRVKPGRPPDKEGRLF